MLYLDYASSADSKICIVTAGATVAGDNKELTAKQNTEIFKEIIPELVKYSPNCILIICSQPGKNSMLLAIILRILNSYCSFQLTL